MPNAISTEILNTGIKDEHLLSLKEWGRFLAQKAQDRREKKPMSTSQIRKFFGEIKRIQADFENCKGEIILLDPKIAYSVGRAKKDGPSKIEDFYNLVNPLLSGVKENKSRFKNFVSIVEAIVAYHKEAGGQ
jgi:CRISPR type III-A-associated protein Csm2